MKTSNIKKSREPYSTWSNWLQAFGWKEVAIDLPGRRHRTINVAVRTTDYHDFVVHGLWWSSQFWSGSAMRLATPLPLPLPKHYPEMVINVGANDNAWMRSFFLHKHFYVSEKDYEDILLKIFSAIYPHKLSVITLGPARQLPELNHWLQNLDTDDLPPETPVHVFQVGDTSYTAKAVQVASMINSSRDWDNMYMYHLLSSQKNP